MASGPYRLLPVTEGYKYALTCADTSSGLVLAFASRKANQTAINTIKGKTVKLSKLEVMCGTSAQIGSDQVTGQRYVHPNVNRSTVHNSQDMEAT